jgi:ABC-2 type transport system permease protein
MIVAKRLWTDRRRSFMWWSFAALASMFHVAFYPSFRKNGSAIDQLYQQMPQSMRRMFGGGDGISFGSPAGFLHSEVFSTLLPIVLLIFAIGFGARALAGAEEDGTLEFTMANPVTRSRFALERYVAMAGMIFGLGGVYTLGLLALAPPFGLLDGVSIPKLIAACFAATCLALLHATIAFAVGGAWGGRARATSVAAGVAVLGYVIFGLVNANVARPLRFLSPFYWYLSRNVIVRGLPLEAVLIPLGLSLVLAAGAIWGFRHRDLH